MPRLKLRVDPVEKVTHVALVRSLAEPEQRRIAADIARQGIEEAKENNKQVLGRVPPYFTTVDGRKHAPLESVKLDGGQIVTEFELVSEVLVWIAAELVARSPIAPVSKFSSGAYRASHVLFADGVAIDDPAMVPVAEEYIFLNPLPYSRRLEIGKTKSGRDFLVSVPNRIYERTAEDAKRRFGNIASIKHSYRAVLGGAIRAHGGAPSRRGGAERQGRMPAIIVRVR